MTIAGLLLYHDVDTKAEKSSREQTGMKQHVHVHDKAMVTVIDYNCGIPSKWRFATAFAKSEKVNHLSVTHWWLLRVTLVVAFGFLHQNFGRWLKNFWHKRSCSLLELARTSHLVKLQATSYFSRDIAIAFTFVRLNRCEQPLAVR